MIFHACTRTHMHNRLFMFARARTHTVTISVCTQPQPCHSKVDLERANITATRAEREILRADAHTQTHGRAHAMTHTLTHAYTQPLSHTHGHTRMHSHARAYTHTQSRARVHTYTVTIVVRTWLCQSELNLHCAQTLQRGKSMRFHTYANAHMPARHTLTISARTQLCQSGLELHCAHTLQQGRTMKFHWGDESKRREIRLKGGTSSTGDWSGGLSLDVCGSIPVRVPLLGEKALDVKVEIRWVFRQTHLPPSHFLSLSLLLCFSFSFSYSVSLSLFLFLFLLLSPTLSFPFD